MGKRQAFRASNRFGLGPRPNELRQIGADPRGWLHHQLAPGPRSQPWLSNVAPSHETLGDLLRKFYRVRSLKRTQKRGGDGQAALADMSKPVDDGALRLSVERAASASQGVALLLAAPGFQWR
jgi:uncharacterized protein (DUF1800 family)